MVTNFAVHLPWIDKLFGTYHLPKDRWPDAYGLGGDHIPDNYTSHLLWPFRRKS
jgi:sterol desaturase/sphingolipid hydroxylase (fatty acid hydroxylase superfamily)